MSTQWIKRTEQKPVEEDLPIVVGVYNAPNQWDEWTVWTELSIAHYTHWRSIKCDPPPSEPTRRERDECFAIALVDRNAGINRVGLALKAIYAERREINDWLNAFFGNQWGRKPADAESTRQLRARLDEQGGGM